MKFCPNCNTQLDDNAVFCPACGTKLAEQAQYQQNQAYAAPYVDPFDHTAEFDPKDISENKVFAVSVYLLGVIGIIIALLASRDSKFVGFHLRQAMKFVIVETLAAICMALLFWTVIVPIAAGIFIAVLGVIEIICFFQACGGKAKEPAIIRSLGFLK